MIFPVKLQRPLIVLLSVCGTVGAADLAEHQTRLVNVTDGVQVLAQGSSQWVDAHIDLPLETGDLIHVDEEGTAEISLSKSALLILDGESDLVMGNTTPIEGHFTLSQGALLVKIESDPTSGNLWEFATPYGVVKAGGSEFALVHNAQDGTHIGVFKGQAELQQAESAEGTYPIQLIQPHQEGVLEKRKPFKKLTAYSEVIKRRFPKANALKRRFVEVANVWVPMTPEYRLVLRRKYIAEVHPSKKPVRQRRTPLKGRR